LQLDPGRVGAEANQLCVGTRARGEALRADVERLEQVRLPRSVRADGENEARPQLQVERRIGAEVAERDRPNDQLPGPCGRLN
jgi:hypothetical protein